VKRATLWVCVAILTFSIGVACAFFWFLDLNLAKQQSNSDGAPPVSQGEPIELLFCHLMAVPNKYDGKIIRVQATYVVGKHGAMLEDETCPRVGGPVWVSMSPEMWEELKRSMERAYEIKNVSGPIDVVFVGGFGRNHSSSRSDALEDTAPYRFDLMRIERTSRPQ
jgi:hypothetical protein